MNLTRNGITLTVDDDSLFSIFLTQLLGKQLSAPVALSAPPRIGAEWAGGVYAGLVRGMDGAPDYHLIAGPEHDSAIDWNAAMKWAPTVKVTQYADYTLPYRREQAILFGNVPDLFKKEVYWSCEELESGSDYAWVQHFDDGGQFLWRKDVNRRARAVRRIPNSII